MLKVTVTAVRVAGLTVLAREHPETPATEAFPDEDVDLLHTLLESQDHWNVVRMPNCKVPDITAVVIDLEASLVPTPRRGSRSPKRRRFGRDSNGCTGRSRCATPSAKESVNGFTNIRVAL